MILVYCVVLCDAGQLSFRWVAIVLRWFVGGCGCLVVRWLLCAFCLGVSGGFEFVPVWFGVCRRWLRFEFVWAGLCGGVLFVLIDLWVFGCFLFGGCYRFCGFGVNLCGWRCVGWWLWFMGLVVLCVLRFAGHGDLMRLGAGRFGCAEVASSWRRLRWLGVWMWRAFYGCFRGWRNVCSGW